MTILSIRNVSKRFQKTAAVDNLSVEIPKGKIFGLLGPNGAGKTTLIRMITSITGADEGDIFIDGEKLGNFHSSDIGYLPEERGLYKKMTVGDQLMYLAQLKGLKPKEAKKDLDEWMEKFDMQSWWKKKVQELSKGMQQKVQFISTVVHKPKLLILDEPFSGLDPINTNLIKDEIHQLNQKGTSIIFSTHRMEQVEEICEFIMLINQGKNILEGRVSDVKEAFKENLYRIEFIGKLPQNMNSQYFQVVSDTDTELVIKVKSGHNSNDLLKDLINFGFHIKSYQEILPSLNEIFIKKVEGKSYE
jgi:ABC-2 type transport system ATP-binding protein